MTAHLHLLPVCLAGLMTCATEAYSQDAITPDFVLAGFRDSRERLTSGAFRGHGVKIDDDPTAGRLEGKFEIASAFDYTQNLFRFDHVETIRVATGAKDAPAAKAWAPEDRGGRFVRTPQRTIRWTLGEKFAAIVGPPTARPPDFVLPFDIRTAGVCTLGGLQSAGGIFTGDFQGAKSFTEKLKYLAKYSNRMTASRVDKSLVRLSWSERYDESAIIFDESRGYLPIRYEIRYTAHGKDHVNPFSLCTTSWNRINGVYVPETMSVREGLAPNRVTTYEYMFEWDHVNKIVPKEIFTVEGMSLPNGLPIMSNETGRTVTLGKVGDKEFPQATIHSAVFGNVPWYSRWWTITGAVVLLTVAALGVVWLRRRRGQLPATP